jgi:carboxyl-terminal processing protease
MEKDTKTPIVVLVNGASASASEIVAGALQDHKRAIIMGSQSFGKGSVQTVAQIDKFNGVKLTIAQYMTPKNRKIQAIGVKPDVLIDNLDEDWLDEHKKNSRYIREKDLRNHLTATIETKEEKKLRLSLERSSRKERARKYQLKKAKGKKEVDIFKKYDPKSDYQVLQAINHIETFKFFNSFIK